MASNSGLAWGPSNLRKLSPEFQSRVGSVQVMRHSRQDT